MPPYNYNPPTATTTTNNNNTVSTSGSGGIVPNRMSHFQKIVDNNGRYYPTSPTQQQVLIAETMSSGNSSLTTGSQPILRPSSSSMTSVQQQHHQSRKAYSGMTNSNKGTTSSGSVVVVSNGRSSNHQYNAMSAPSSSPKSNYYNHSVSAAVNESSVIFQKSAGLSKLLAPSSSPSSPKGQQHKQQRTTVDNTKNENHNNTTTLDESNTSTAASSTASPSMTSTRYASAIRRNRILQRSLSPRTAATATTGSTPDSPTVAAITTTVTTTAAAAAAPLSPNSNSGGDRRTRQHRMLRQNRRPSSMMIQQQQQHRSSLSPPSKANQTDSITAERATKTMTATTSTATGTNTNTNTAPTGSPTKSSTATSVAAAMIAAAASRRLEKASTTSSPTSSSLSVQQPARNKSSPRSSQLNTTQYPTTTTTTTKSSAAMMNHHQRRRPINEPYMSVVAGTAAAASHNITALAHYHQVQHVSMPQHLQQPQLSPTIAATRSPRSGSHFHQQQHATTTTALHQSPMLHSGSPVARVRNRQLSPKLESTTTTHHTINRSIDHRRPRQQYANEHYHDVIDTASSLSPKDRYESIQQQQQQSQQRRREYDEEDHEQYHSSRMTRHPHSPPMVHRSQQGQQQYPELPSLLPAIGNDPPLQQQQPTRNDIDDPYSLQQMVHMQINQQRTAQKNNDKFEGIRGDVTPNNGANPDGHSVMMMMSNSPGASPYSHYPVPRSSKKSSADYNNRLVNRQKNQYNNHHHLNRQRNPIDDVQDGEEKKFSEPLPMHQHQQSGLHRTSSSSDYETDYSRSDNNIQYQNRRMMGGSTNHKVLTQQYRGDRALKDEPTFSNMSASQVTPDVAAFFEQSSGTKSRSIRDDDTYDYGDRDDDYDDDDAADLAEAAAAAATAANGSVHDDTDSQGSLSYEQRRKKLEKEREARAAAVAAAKAEMEGPFMKQDDVEHYRKVVDTPLGRTAAGVAAAATIGCIVLGPVGLFLGVAAVGIGVGYMQIPEEQRHNMNSKVTDAMKSAQESAIDASEKLSVNCLTTYKDSGIAEHVPVEMETCCVNIAGLDGTAPKSAGHDDDASLVHDYESGDINEDGNVVHSKLHDKRRVNTPTHSNWHRGKSEKISCLRKGKIVPVAQIHALDPSAQPRAWLDVLANADTSSDEKIEAMEEVLILAKDKQKSRIFVDEGILDCLLWTIGRYVEKQKKGPGSEVWANPDVKPEDRVMVKLAANCCVTLGKSYCAAIHTEGDLLLMSLYDRGTVPEERQLAQMLMEVPHHTRTTKTDDPTIVVPGKESFAIKQLTLSQAEELASVITSIATGKERPQVA